MTRGRRGKGGRVEIGTSRREAGQGPRSWMGGVIALGMPTVFATMATGPVAHPSPIHEEPPRGLVSLSLSPFRINPIRMEGKGEDRRVRSTSLFLQSLRRIGILLGYLFLLGLFLKDAVEG